MIVRSYVKRLCMEATLRDPALAVLPPGVCIHPWHGDLLDAHADVKYRAFRFTADATIFPNLRSEEGCRRIMHSIIDHPGFLPGATWLAVGEDGPCGCIQGVEGPAFVGSIQNLAVVPEWRGQGLGSALLQAALAGFQAVGLRSARLEVCAKNASALRLYHTAGFQIRKTLYRETQAEYAEYLI